MTPCRIGDDTGVAQMNRVIRQNAVIAEESARASEQFTARAKAVNDRVNEFAVPVGGTQLATAKPEEKMVGDRDHDPAHGIGRTFGERAAGGANAEPVRKILLNSDRSQDYVNS